MHGRFTAHDTQVLWKTLPATQPLRHTLTLTKQQLQSMLHKYPPSARQRVHKTCKSCTACSGSLLHLSLVWYTDVDVSCRYSMLKIALGAEFNSEKMFKDVAELASRYKGVQLHTHVAENPVWPSV